MSTPDTTQQTTSVLSPTARIVCVDARFPGHSQLYSYFVPEGDAPQVGDYILTSLNLGHRPQYSGPAAYDVDNTTINHKLATIVELHTLAQPKATKHYLMLIPQELIVQRRKKNETWLKRRKAAADIRTQLEKRVRELDRMVIYERAAQNDEETRRLLDELRAVGL